MAANLSAFPPPWPSRSRPSLGQRIDTPRLFEAIHKPMDEADAHHEAISELPQRAPVLQMGHAEALLGTLS